jgi:hypothetical protein
MFVFVKRRCNEFIVKITEKGFYAFAYREWEYMDILNFDEMKKP